MSRCRTIDARRRRAAAIVFVAIALLAAAIAFAPESRPSILREAASAAVEESGTDPPQGFEDEALQLDGWEDVRVDRQNGIIGFSWRGSVEEVLASIEEELRGKGWSGVESGNDGQESFVKSSGRYRWMFVSCVRVGAWTSVVVQYVPEAESR